MAKEEEKKKEETKQEEPQTLKIGDKDIPVEEVVKYYENKAKFETEYHKSREQVNKLTSELEETRKKIEELNPKGGKPEEVELPPFNDDNFIEALVDAVNTSKKELKELKKENAAIKEALYKDTIEEVQRINLDRINKFQKDNELTEEEKTQIAQIVQFSHRNIKRADGRIYEVPMEAFEDALLVLKKDEVKKKAKEAGEDEILKQLFGKGKPKMPEGKDETGEPTLEWLASHWDELSDEDKEKHRSKLRG